MEEKITQNFDFASHQIQGHRNKRKNAHSDFDPYVEKLTSGSSTEIISPFGRINVVAVMLPKSFFMIRNQIAF